MQQERESAELCLNGCGFFGAPGSGGMCSVCWKKTMSDRQAATASSTSVASPRAAVLDPMPAVTSPSTTSSSSCAAAACAAPIDETATASAASSPPLRAVQKNKKRCWECKKKVGLTAMDCRCGYVFCSSHRFEDQHQCSFDFRSADRRELARRNPGGGVFSKLEKL